MKKIIMLALVLTSLTVTAFSTPSNAINQKVLITFSKTFSNAQEVKWEFRKDFYKATFKVHDQIMFAYYNEDGSQLAVSRNLHISQLPISLATELQNDNKDSWLTNLFEMSSENETAYYATVETGTHITILKADGASGWTVFKKDRK